LVLIAILGLIPKARKLELGKKPRDWKGSKKRKISLLNGEKRGVYRRTGKDKVKSLRADPREIGHDFLRPSAASASCGEKINGRKKKNNGNSLEFEGRKGNDGLGSAGHLLSTSSGQLSRCRGVSAATFEVQKEGG